MFYLVKMVKRGRPITEPRDTFVYHHPITNNMTNKKFFWNCETCGKEYFFRNQAVECEVSHRPKPKLESYADYRARLAKEVEARKKWRRENMHLEEAEYQAIKAQADTLPDAEYFKLLKAHHKRWWPR